MILNVGNRCLRWCSIALVLGCPGIANALDSSVEDGMKMVFQPDWFPNGQFSGFFWAERAGIYHEVGIDISFNQFDFGTDFLGMVERGEATIGTAEAYILMDAVSKGKELVALGAVLGESPAGYIYLKDSGIRKASDIEGKTVGVHAYADALLPFFVQHAGLSLDSVTAKRVEHHIEILLDGSVDLHQGYAIDEIIQLQRKTDRELGILLFEELGMPMYSMVIYSSRSFVEKNSVWVERFLEASAEGWVEAVNSPRVSELIVNGPYADDRVDDGIIAEQIAALKRFVVIDGRQPLSMTRSKWEAIQAAYLRSGMIDEPVDLDRMLYRPR